MGATLNARTPAAMTRGGQTSHNARRLNAVDVPYLLSPGERACADAAREGDLLL